MDDGKGGKIVCQFNDPFNKGAEFGQWCPVGIIRQHNVKDYEAFEQVTPVFRIFSRMNSDICIELPA